MTTSTGSGARLPGRRFIAISLAAAFVAALWSTPAAAHGFAVVVVVPMKGEAAPTGGDALAGFRAAVDESPDVSHPPGIDGGDHLGGMDVHVAPVDGGSSPETAAASVREQLAAGASIVVLLEPQQGVRAVLEETLADADLVVVAGGAGGWTDRPGRGGTILVTEAEVEAGRRSAFEERYRTTHASSPTAAAIRGYDAGVVLDVAVGTFGPDGLEADRVVGAVEGSRRLVGSQLLAEPTRPRPREAPQRSYDLPPPMLWVTAGVVIAAAVTVVGARVRRRRRG